MKNVKKLMMGNKTIRNKKKDALNDNYVNKKQKLEEENISNNNYKIKLIFNNDSNGSNLSILSQLLS
jgi:hypothetical protein